MHINFASSLKKMVTHYNSAGTENIYDSKVALELNIDKYFVQNVVLEFFKISRIEL